MKSHPLTRLLAVAALAVLPALGCTGEAKKDNSPDARETPPTGRQQGSDEAPSAKEVGQDIKEAGRDVKDAAEKAAETVKDTAEGLAPKVDAAKQLADVKMALMADPSVDASAINVDAEEATKTIHLKGTVPTAAQKSAAERIARSKAEGWKIRNVLTVAAR